MCVSLKIAGQNLRAEWTITMLNRGSLGRIDIPRPDTGVISVVLDTVGHLGLGIGSLCLSFVLFIVSLFSVSKALGNQILIL